VKREGHAHRSAERRAIEVLRRTTESHHVGNHTGFGQCAIRRLSLCTGRSPNRKDHTQSEPSYPFHSVLLRIPNGGKLHRAFRPRDRWLFKLWQRSCGELTVALQSWLPHRRSLNNCGNAAQKGPENCEEAKRHSGVLSFCYLCWL